MKFMFITSIVVYVLFASKFSINKSSFVVSGSELGDYVDDKNNGENLTIISTIRTSGILSTERELKPLEPFDVPDPIEFHFTPTTMSPKLSPEINVRDSSNVSITLQEVDKLLQSKETMEFLNSITNEAKRSVAKEQLRYCPYSNFCTFSFNLTLPFGNVSSCNPCSCTKNDSHTAICPDALDYYSFGELQIDIYDCFPMYMKPPKEDPFNELTTYRAIYRCPSKHIGTIEETRLCQREERDLTFANTLPVTDKDTNITYINLPCALCHDVMTQNLVAWEPTLSCDERETHNYSTETEFLEFALNTQSCNLNYALDKSAGAAVSVCPPIITKCNETKRWRSFDPFIQSACAFYENIYSIEVAVGKPRRKYRNIFCALCNGEVPSSYTVYDHEQRWLSPSHMYSFSGLLKFDNRQAEPARGNDCPTGFIYDVVRKDCVELQCAHMRKLQYGMCELVYRSIGGVDYIFTASLYPDGNMEFTPMIEFLVLTQFEQLFNSVFFRNFFIKKHHYSVYTSICYKNIRPRFVKVCYNQRPVCSENFDHYEVELHIQITQYHDVVDILKRYSNMLEFPLNLTVTDEAVTNKFVVKPKDFGGTLPARNDSILFQDNCSKRTEMIVLAKQTSCPLVKLGQSVYNWVEDSSVIRFNYQGVVLTDSQFYFGPNKNTVLVCSDIYKNYFSVVSERIMLHEDNWKKFDISTILSIICISVSLLCLLLSFGTFCVFPSLRTLPGKNNMALIFSLFLAQSLYLTGSFSGLEQDSVECMALGLCTHFFWLMSIFWMNLCTFHVFRVFTSTENPFSGKGLKTFLFYWLYPIVLSVSLILANIIFSLHSSGYKDFGYGRITCYISSEKMVSFTFGVPVGLVVIANICMFLLFVRSVVRMPKMQTHVKNERNDIIIFAKLSTLTGVCWIFGFIYSWTGATAFSYLFILLNASQGVFIFLSFVCSRRVLLMYRNRVSEILTSTGSQRTKMTDSQGAGFRSK